VPQQQKYRHGKQGDADHLSQILQLVFRRVTGSQFHHGDKPGQAGYFQEINQFIFHVDSLYWFETITLPEEQAGWLGCFND
jgi:hypothetical protein